MPSRRKSFFYPGAPQAVHFPPIGLVVPGQGVGGVDRSSLYVVGDSTAKGDQSDTAAGKWATICSGDASLTLSNAGASGQSIAVCLSGVQADTAHRSSQTVLMDMANAGETAAGWLAAAASIVALQPFILIWPQVGVTDGSMSGADLTRMADINTGIIANFPNNTFDLTEQTALIAAFNDATMRQDGLHRNDKGQALEAFYASSFLQRKGWRSMRSEASALIARMTGVPDAKRQSYINALVERQVGMGAWTSYDCFHVLAAHDDQAHTLNWISSSFPLTKTGTVTFVADRGDTGNGTNGKMGTGFDPAVASSPKFTQNDARLVVYPVTDVVESKTDIGSATVVAGQSRIQSRNADNSQSLRLNQGSTSSRAGGGANKTLFALCRADSANLKVQVSSAIVQTIAVASAPPAGGEISYCGADTFGTKQIGMGSVGSSVSDVIAAKDHYSRTAWLKALGVPLA